MNKPALLTMGKTLGEDKLHVITIFDMEPSGIIVQAYNQTDSQEYILSVSERELAASNVTRAKDKLTYLVNTLFLSAYGGDGALALQSSLGNYLSIHRTTSLPFPSLPFLYLVPPPGFLVASSHCPTLALHFTLALTRTYPSGR
jgi:hypothetical protein